jgi:hypothetical protein
MFNAEKMLALNFDIVSINPDELYEVPTLCAAGSPVVTLQNTFSNS